MLSLKTEKKLAIVWLCLFIAFMVFTGIWSSINRNFFNEQVIGSFLFGDLWRIIVWVFIAVPIIWFVPCKIFLIRRTYDKWGKLSSPNNYDVANQFMVKSARLQPRVFSWAAGISSCYMGDYDNFYKYKNIVEEMWNDSERFKSRYFSGLRFLYAFEIYLDFFNNIKDNEKLLKAIGALYSYNKPNFNKELLQQIYAFSSQDYATSKNLLKLETTNMFIQFLNYYIAYKSKKELNEDCQEELNGMKDNICNGKLQDLFNSLS